jgi:dihydroxy-acid dehydratase
VSGQTVGEVLTDVSVADEEVIHTLERPVSKAPTLVIVRGSLLPGGGIVRLGGERVLKFTGPANVFHSREEAMEAIGRGDVKPGQVVVLRGLGVKGGPGLAMTSSVVFALDGAGLIDKVGVVTEGQLSGLVNRGLVVGEASPEAMEGGPIGLVDNGDPITIDVGKRVVELDVPDDELKRRAEQPREYGSRSERGWLSIYQRTVQPVHKGAVLLK